MQGVLETFWGIFRWKLLLALQKTTYTKLEMEADTLTFSVDFIYFFNLTIKIQIYLD